MKAKNFKLRDEENKWHELKDYLGSWVVVYFYPKDNTPGCTRQACNLRDNMEELKKHGVSVLGISKDSIKSHSNFSNKYRLNFPILSDESMEVAKMYGVWGEKKFMGKSYQGVSRVTFLIDKDGQMVKRYDKVSVDSQAEDILKDIRAIEKAD